MRKIAIKRSDMIIIGHRGAPKEMLENTRPSFAAAKEAGAQRIEFDVQLSKDNIPFIFHDVRLGRLARSRGFLANCNASQLKKILHINGEPILEFAELIEEFSDDLEFNVELKIRASADAMQIATYMKRFHFRNRVIISCFSKAPLEAFQAVYGDAEIACLFEGGLSEQALGPWYRRRWLRRMRRLNARIIHPHDSVVDAAFMKWARANNFEVYPYTSLYGIEDTNRVQLWDRLHNLKVDGLCTNYPREMCNWLQSRQ